MTASRAWLRDNQRLFPPLFALAVSSAMSVALLAFRIYYSETITFYFLVWNLFLAWIPLLFALAMRQTGQRARHSHMLMVVLFFGWLTFFPNAPYIVTDFLHLSPRASAPLWYDLMVIFSFAWNGLILGFTSLWMVQQQVQRSYGTVAGWLLAAGVLALSGFGIYLGRFLRWNSWDLIASPHALAADILERFLNPLAHPQTLAVTVLYSGFLLVAYVTVVLLTDAGGRLKIKD